MLLEPLRPLTLSIMAMTLVSASGPQANVECFDRFHMTPLHLAATRGHRGVVDELIRGGYSSTRTWMRLYACACVWGVIVYRPCLPVSARPLRASVWQRDQDGKTVQDRVRDSFAHPHALRKLLPVLARTTCVCTECYVHVRGCKLVKIKRSHVHGVQRTWLTTMCAPGHLM